MILFSDLHLKAKRLRKQRKEEEEDKTARITAGTTREVASDERSAAETMIHVQQDTLFTLNLPVEEDDGEEKMIKLIRETAEACDVSSSTAGPSSTALYDLFHFLLDYLKYLVPNKVAIRKTSNTRIVKWLQFIGSSFLAYSSDRDVRRRAFQISLLALSIAEETDRVLLYPYYCTGLAQYVKMVNGMNLNNKDRSCYSLADWWRLRKQNPICEFMLDSKEIRDLTCMKLAIRLALDLFLQNKQETYWSEMKNLIVGLVENWESEIIALFSDHDSELLLVLSRLLLVADPRSNFRLLLSFLDSIDFDQDSLLDLLLVDQDTMFLYLQGILSLIAQQREVFEQICLEKSRQNGKSATSTFEEEIRGGSDLEDETDYLSSTACTLADLVTLLQKTGRQSQLPLSSAHLSTLTDAVALSFPSL